MCVLVNCVCHLLGFQTASYAPLMYLKVSTTQRFHLQNAPLQPPHFPTPSLHQSPYPTSPPILLPHSPSPPLPHSLIPNPLLPPPSLPYSPTPSLQPLTPLFSHSFTPPPHPLTPSLPHSNPSLPHPFHIYWYLLLARWCHGLLTNHWRVTGFVLITTNSSYESHYDHSTKVGRALVFNGLSDAFM